MNSDPHASTAVADITDRSRRMPPNATILYPARNQTGDDPPAHIGIIRITEGGLYWVRAWPRLVNGRPVIELRLTPKS